MLSSFRNAIQGLVMGFKKGCHSRFYTHRTLVNVQLSTQGQGLLSVFLSSCPGTSLALHSHSVNVPAMLGEEGEFK